MFGLLGPGVLQLFSWKSRSKAGPLLRRIGQAKALLFVDKCHSGYHGDGPDGGQIAEPLYRECAMWARPASRPYR